MTATSTAKEAIMSRLNVLVLVLASLVVFFTLGGCEKDCSSINESKECCKAYGECGEYQLKDGECVYVPTPDGEKCRWEEGNGGCKLGCICENGELVRQTKTCAVGALCMTAICVDENQRGTKGEDGKMHYYAEAKCLYSQAVNGTPCGPRGFVCLGGNCMDFRSNMPSPPVLGDDLPSLPETTP